MGPLQQDKPWSNKGVQGVYRFLQRVWRLMVNEDTGELLGTFTEEDPNRDQLKTLHETIRKVTEDLDGMRFNTAISALMVFVNEANKWETLPKAIVEDFLLLLSPFAPHIAEELWNKLGHNQSLAYEDWPEWKEEYLKAAVENYPVQVNGKVRANIDIPAEKAKDKAYVLEQAKQEQNVSKYLEEGELVKEIFVPGRIVNLVVK